jgi:hypothetical protein
VQNALGAAVADRDVTFTVLSGPDGGKTEVVATDGSGQAQFAYAGNGGTGVDEIQASFVDERGTTQFSNVALEEWFAVERPPLAQCHDISRSVSDACTLDVLPAEVGQGTSDPDGDPLAFALDPPGPFALGNTPVTLNVTDNSGLSASCTANVTALDATAPVLVLPGDISQGCAPPQGAAVAFATSATDNCGAASVTCTDGAGRSVSSGAVFPIGTTSVTCSASDASGNVATQSFSISVSADPVAPATHCPTPPEPEQDCHEPGDRHGAHEPEHGQHPSHGAHEPEHGQHAPSRH